MWPRPFIYILSVTAFALQWQSGVVVTIAAETRWPSKGKIFPIWPFTEEVWQPLVYARESYI